jgi:hypothetical protein
VDARDLRGGPPRGKDSKVVAVRHSLRRLSRGLKAQVKPPVYVVIDISEMSDADAFAKAAAVATPNDLASAGGRYIIRFTKPVALDGTAAPSSRFVVLALR